jgi:hypothetical protein
MSKQPTIEDLRTYKDELVKRFGRYSNVAYTNVSQTQLSISRQRGSANVSGELFLYNDTDDSLIRKDVAEWIVRRKAKEKKLEEKTGVQYTQKGLFNEE